MGQSTGDGAEPQRGDLARAALLAVANSVDLFGDVSGAIAGVPYSAMYPVLEEAPRYLHWLASQGYLGTVHPWVAIAAGDLGRRVRWRRLRPRRGAGRLLWMCEQMATPALVHELVPRLWHAATARGHDSPDWPAGARPGLCRLDDAGYQDLMRERASGVTFGFDCGRVTATGPAAAVLVVWAGERHRCTPVRRGIAGDDAPAGPDGGVAVFTWRGDHRATGWLDTYGRCALPPP